MKELERWWRWFDNEKPGLERALKLLHELLTDTEKDALRCAAGFIACRQDRARLSFVTATGDIHQLRHVMSEQPAALRDMSLELCRSFERMLEQVPVLPSPAKEAMPKWFQLRERASDDAADSLAYGVQAALRTQDEQRRLFRQRAYDESFHSKPFRTEYLGGGYYMRPINNYSASGRVVKIDVDFKEVP